MNVPLVLTPGVLVGRLHTPLSCNGFQIFWELVDATTSIPVDPSGVALDFGIELPSGTTIPFDINPVAASEYHIEPTACSGSVTIKVSVSGLSPDMLVKLYMNGLF